MSHNSSFFTLLPPSPYLPLSERSGLLPFPLTNDYMFKAVFQTDETALCSLLCSLLDLTPEDIESILIVNALVPGFTIERKDTILDIRLILNGDRLINLEMQIKNEGNWPERSLCYLCRAFDNVEKGASYLDVTPAHHIGILSFGLPHMQKQFYSHYYMTNDTTHEILSDKIRLSVLDLTQTALATDHDRQSGLTRWAAAFKATTWEEFQMLSEEDILFQKVSDALYLLSENREVAEQCRRIQEAEAREKWRQAQLAEMDKALTEKNNALAEKDSAIAEKDSALAEKNNLIAERDSALAEKDNLIAEKDSAIAEKDAELARLRAQIKALSHDC